MNAHSRYFGYLWDYFYRNALIVFCTNTCILSEKEFLDYSHVTVDAAFIRHNNAVAHSDQISKLIDMEITLYVVCKITQISTLEPVLRIHHACYVETSIEDISLHHIEH